MTVALSLSPTLFTPVVKVSTKINEEVKYCIKIEYKELNVTSYAHDSTSSRDRTLFTNSS
jgi:hypothetical protein